MEIILKVSYQGGLDGLCGMYALVNAYMMCGCEDGEDILLEACRALAKSRWPEVLVKGTTFADMQRMAKRCKDVMGIDHVQLRYPFKRQAPRSNEVYWQRFHEVFKDQDVACAIIGVEDPMMHWIVAAPEKGHIMFMDSKAGEPFFQKKQSSLVAGSRKQKPGQWLINPAELILFTRP